MYCYPEEVVYLPGMSLWICWKQQAINSISFNFAIQMHSFTECEKQRSIVTYVEKGKSITGTANPRNYP